MQYGVWCTVSGGRTGYREAWCKDIEQKIKLFDDIEAAQTEADRCRAQISPHTPCDITYTAMPYND